MERELGEKEELAWEEAQETAELPPYITEVLCGEVTEEGENKGKMEYIVSFDTKDRQTTSGHFTLRVEGEDPGKAVEVSVPEGEMTGVIYYAPEDGEDYFLYVYPTGHPEARSKGILALSKGEFRVSRVGFVDRRKMLFDYQCEKVVPDNVVVGLQGTDSTGASIAREVTLVPFGRTIDLYDYGVEELPQLKVSACAHYLDCGARIVFTLAEQYTVEVEEPEVGWIHTERVSGSLDGEDAVQLEVSMKQTVYEDAELMAELFREGEALYRCPPVSLAQSAQAYQLQIPAGQMETDGFREYEMRFRCRKDKLFTNASRAYRMLLQTPEIQGMELGRTKEGGAWNVSLQMAGGYDAPHCYAVKELDTAVPPFRGADGTERILLKDTTLSAVSPAYLSGVVRGPFQKELQLKKEQFYVLKKDGAVVICLSETPDIAMDTGIQVGMEGVSCTETVGTGLVFQLETEGGRTWLKMSDDVWDFSNVAKDQQRERVRQDYDAFLKELESKGYTAFQLRRIRGVIGDYLPMTLEEQSFYKFRFRTDYEEAKSTLELFPGVEVCVNYSSYEWVGDESDSEYLNDYVASAQERFCVVEREDKLCLDPFVGRLGNGSYVDMMLQPKTAAQGRSSDEGYYTIGGAAVIDLQSSGMERPYVMLAYHSKFPAVGRLVNPMMARNEALLAAPTYTDLGTGVQYFFQYNATDCPEADIKGGYLKGRVHMTPCMEIYVNGHPCRVPFFTTIADVVQRFGLDTARLRLQREGRPVDGDYGDLCHIPLYLGDRLSSGEAGE